MLKKQDNKGFTIIEVLIVLAIAGLILLVVFLAIPALQRSQRNNQRKQESARFGTVVTECVANKPTLTAAQLRGVDGCGSPQALGLAAGVNATARITIQAAGYERLSFAGYDLPPAPDMTTANTNSDTITWRVGARCGNDGASFVADPTNFRGVAVIYKVETANAAATGGLTCFAVN